MRNKKLILLLALVLSLTSLTACDLPGLGSSGKSDNIVIASGSVTEREIVNEIIYQMIKYHMPDTPVSMIHNLGNSTLISQALSQRSANVSGLMYTGSTLTGELGMDPIMDPIEAYDTVVKEYYDRFGRVWFPTYGFENTYAIMVTRELADSKNLTKVSDLKDFAGELRCGTDASWMQRDGDGYEAFKETYFDFGEVFPMDISLVYSAVATGEMDVVVGYSTDGRIPTYDLVLLEDDLRVFPPYDTSPIAYVDVIQKNPELIKVFLRLAGQIDNSQMQIMNRRADEDLVEASTVAKDFLEEHNYFEDVELDPEEVKHYESLK